MSGRILLDSAAEEPKPAEPTPPPPPSESPPPPTPPEPPPAREAEASPESTPPPAAELSPEVQKRFDRLTWEKYEAQRRQQEAEQRLAERERERQAAQRPYGPPGEAEAEQRGYQRAQQESATARFNEACNAVYAKGRQEYGEAMDEAVRGLNAVGWGNRPDLLAAIVSLPDGHRVYHALASNLDEAHRVLQLPPMEMAMALANLRQQQSNGHAPPPSAAVSRAPAPISPIGGQSRAPQVPLEKLTMREFITQRDRAERGSSTRIRR